MKFTFKKLILLISFTLLFLIFLSGKVKAANSIEKITMDVWIDSNGNASITEVWNCSLTSGTEGYKPYGNLGNSKISNFTVSDDSGTTYKTLSNWKTNATFDKKAYKCGINQTSKDTELCWGISSYGSRTYTLKYTITNFINQYKDSQGIYFSFISKKLKQSPDSVKVTISSDMPFTNDNSKIWAFGYPSGTIQYSNQKIVLDSQGSLPSSNYMVGLVQIQNGTFKTSNRVSKTFDEVYQEAMSDVKDSSSSRISPRRSSGSFSSFSILPILFMFLFNPIVWILVAILILKRKKKSTNPYRPYEKFDFGPNGTTLPNAKEISYFRDIPCKNDIYLAYWIITQFELLSEEYRNSGLLGAILLEWIRNGSATICKTKKGIFSLKDNNYAIDLSQVEIGSNDVENKLISMLKKASGSNEILEAKELKNWCQKNYSSINYWFKEVIAYETIHLQNSNLITKTTTEVPGMFGIARKVITNHVDASIKNYAIELRGLKKFLLDYSMISKKEAIEVHLWEDYLIFAQLLGIADKVEEQFSKLYPNFNQVSRINTEYTTICTRSMVSSGIHSASVARDRAAYSSSSYSSGDGGSSFSGGGGSADGTSSGGGFR